MFMIMEFAWDFDDHERVPGQHRENRSSFCGWSDQSGWLNRSYARFPGLQRQALRHECGSLPHLSG